MFTRAPAILPIFWTALRAWWDDDALRLGASLAYYTLFALAPILLVATAVAGIVFGAEAVRGEIVGQLDHLVGPEGPGPCKVSSRGPVIAGQGSSRPPSASSRSSSPPPAPFSRQSDAARSGFEGPAVVIGLSEVRQQQAAAAAGGLAPEF